MPIPKNIRLDCNQHGIDPSKNNRKIIFLGIFFIIDKKQTEKWSWRRLKNGIPVKNGKNPMPG